MNLFMICVMASGDVRSEFYLNAFTSVFSHGKGGISLDFFGFEPSECSLDDNRRDTCYAGK